MKVVWIIVVLLVTPFASSFCQSKIDLDGQLSLFGSISPDNDLPMFLGLRYIPELEHGFNLSSGATIDFMASANLSASSFFNGEEEASQRKFDPYRLWARYSTNQLEMRVGLQKINFGSSSLLRPLQWFNQVDVRDPLQITEGVYGFLGRYYFLNNANTWVWLLYGNDKRRGLDFFVSDKKRPELGGRIQLPLESGEIAFSFHNRTVDINPLSELDNDVRPVQNKIGIDGKFDAKVGLWFEATHSFSSEDLGIFAHRTLIALGTDYTYDIGSGLNLGLEHLTSTFDSSAFSFKNASHFSALSGRYALGFFDGFSGFVYYSWDSNDLSAFASYDHQFQNFVGYFMAFYSPSSSVPGLETEFLNSFSGPGIRLMAVFNH